jgi:hypothetical protein
LAPCPQRVYYLSIDNRVDDLFNRFLGAGLIYKGVLESQNPQFVHFASLEILTKIRNMKLELPSENAAENPIEHLQDSLQSR